MSNEVASSARKRRPGHVFSAWLPVLLCVLVIAIESTPYFGADHTTGPLRRFCEWLLSHHFADTRWDEVHHYIRKCGHFTGYGILSAAWFRGFWMTMRSASRGFESQWKLHGLAILGTLLVASADEFHQSFLPNRTSSIYDVLLDCTGGFVMQLVIWLVMRRLDRGTKYRNLAA